ncbi:MAG TPA: DUF3810 domain-containing protein [Candidatus Eisenbergiella intestinipullorum]|nr:DUF3810 domain-containing protein [Candidatus Eisenbergiella intestinipullorum]
MRKKIWAALLLLTAAVNVAAWNSQAFCDWHVAHLFPLSVNVYGRLMSIFPFSVGEGMIVLAVLFTAAAVLMVPARIFVRGGRGKRLISFFCRAWAWTFLGVFMIMTWNCFILYHASEFDETYMADRAQRTYTDRELIQVRNHIVKELNALTEELERDEDGLLVYRGDMKREAIAAMQGLGEEYGLLAGYYPQAKEIAASDFLSQQYMMGYYFPFSMEANYSTSMYIANVPATLCHELAHLKGFIYEDDANFIGFLACIRSEDPFYRYSGYLSVLSYVESEYRKASGKQEFDCPGVAGSVRDDDIFLTSEAWEKVEEKAVVETAVVKAASSQFTETTLVINGVSDGMKSYSRVVRLLLEYYDGILYNCAQDGGAVLAEASAG